VRDLHVILVRWASRGQAPIWTLARPEGISNITSCEWTLERRNDAK